MIALVWQLALAAPTVTAIEVLDARGRWAEVAASGEAVVLREGAEVSLTQGLELADGEEVRTAMARVLIALDDGEHLHVAEGSRIELGERSALQSLGELYLQLRGPFQVRYLDVEATVEGTRFWVGGTPDAVRVGVEEGAVWVRSAGEVVHVEGGEVATGYADAPPTEPERWESKRADLGDLWRLGRPRVELVALAGLGAMDGTAGLGRLQARVPVTAASTLVVGGGFARSVGTMQVPFDVMMELGLPSASFGWGLAGGYEEARLDCPGAYRAVHLGGAAQVRVRHEVAGSWAVHGLGRAALVGAPIVSVEAGIGYSL